MTLLLLFILYLTCSLIAKSVQRAAAEQRHQEAIEEQRARQMARERAAEQRQLEAARRAEYKRQIAEQKQIEAEHKARQRQLEAEQREADKLSLLQSKAIQSRIDIDYLEPLRGRLEAELDTVYEELEAMRITVNGSSASNCSEYIPPIAQARVDKLNREISAIDKKLEKAYYAVNRFEIERARCCNA